VTDVIPEPRIDMLDLARVQQCPGNLERRGAPARYGRPDGGSTAGLRAVPGVWPRAIYGGDGLIEAVMT